MFTTFARGLAITFFFGVGVDLLPSSAGPFQRNLFKSSRFPSPTTHTIGTADLPGVPGQRQQRGVEEGRPGDARRQEGLCVLPRRLRLVLHRLRASIPQVVGCGPRSW